jgi:hypothetical protein
MRTLFAASLSTCITNAYQAWLQKHGLTSAEYPQNQFKLDLAEGLMKLMRELRAGRSSRSSTRELDIDDTVGSEDGTAIFNGHVPVKPDMRLLCDVCKAAQTTINCQGCGVHLCSPATGRQGMAVHMAQGVAGSATGISKRKRS